MKRTLIVVVGAIALVVIVVLGFRGSKPDAGGSAASKAAAARMSAKRTFSKGGKTTLPKPATAAHRAAAVAKVAESPAPSPADTETTGTKKTGTKLVNPKLSAASDNLKDKRTGAFSAIKTAELNDRLKVMRDDIGRCLEGWDAVEPDLHGKVMLGFDIDHDGLQKAWIIDHVDVPAGPLTCFANAVYALDWSDLTADPIQLTHEFTYGQVAEGGPGGRP